MTARRAHTWVPDSLYVTGWATTKLCTCGERHRSALLPPAPAPQPRRERVAA